MKLDPWKGVALKKTPELTKRVEELRDNGHPIYSVFQGPCWLQVDVGFELDSCVVVKSRAKDGVETEIPLSLSGVRKLIYALQMVEGYFHEQDYIDRGILTPEEGA